LNKSITPLSFDKWCSDPNRSTLVMGIVNVTPDSFSDGGKFYRTDSAINHALEMINDGADIIDVGGESSRPGAKKISIDEELDRIIPVIKGIRLISPNVLISIDTTKSVVAENAISVGANIVNDISGLAFDPDMVQIASKLKIPIVIMHMKGIPENMQDNPCYNNIIFDIKLFFKNQINLAIEAGVKKENIILDPGIGFGKTVEHNFIIINKLNEFCEFDIPLLIGPSRKSFIGITLDLPVENRFEGTAAVTTAGILNGARIIRVHNVKKIKRIVAITEKIRRAI